MRDPHRTFWLQVGRILPRRIRERIFEPSYYDLLADALDERDDAPSPSSRWRLELRMLWTTLECFGMGVSGLLVQNRRPTRITWALFGVTLLSTLLIAMRSSYENG